MVSFSLLRLRSGLVACDCGVVMGRLTRAGVVHLNTISNAPTGLQPNPNSKVLSLIGIWKVLFTHLLLSFFQTEIAIYGVFTIYSSSFINLGKI